MRAAEIKEAMATCPSFGERLAAFRIRKGWSLGELAKAANTSRPYISTIENDHHKPSPYGVRKLAFALDVTAEELLTGELPTRSSSAKPKAVA